MKRLTEENIAGLLKKTCGWDGLSRKLWENDGEKNLRKYEYDGLGRIVKETDSDDREFLYKYDAHGNVTEYIDGRKTKFVREYTKTDLLKKEMAFVLETDKTYSETPTETRNYEYDEAGCLISAGDTKATVAYNQLSGKYESDAYGNICSMKWDKTGFEMKYDYDLLGRTTGVTTPDGKTVNYSYDKNGLLTAMDGIIKGNVNYETKILFKKKRPAHSHANGLTNVFFDR